MDVRIEAAPIGAVAVMLTVTVNAQKVEAPKAAVRMAQVVSFARLSIGGTSLNAVAPDHIFEGGTALGAA